MRLRRENRRPAAASMARGNAGTYSTPFVANGAEIGACGQSGGNLCKFVP